MTEHLRKHDYNSYNPDFCDLDYDENYDGETETETFESRVKPQKRISEYGEHSNFELYLADLAYYPPLSHKETKELIRKAQAGDLESKKAVTEGNLRLVLSIAKRYFAWSDVIDPMDIIQSGNEGLMTAIEKYDCDRKTKFSTYAFHWIKQSICKFISENAHAIRLPAGIVEHLIKLNRAEGILFAKLERVPTDEELAEYLHLSVSRVRNIRSAAIPPKSLNQSISPDGNDSSWDADATVQDMIEDNRYNPEKAAMRKAQSEAVNKILGELSPRNCDIMKARYGFYGNGPVSLTDLSKKHGISKQRIQQIENTVIKNYKSKNRSNKALKEIWDDFQYLI